MPYTDNVPHAGSAEILFTGLYDEPAGTAAKTMPRALCTAATLGPLSLTGQVAVRAIPLPAGLVTANIAILFGSTGATGPTHLWLGLTDAQLNVLAVTADQLAAAQTASTFTKIALLTPFQVPYTGLYYVAVSSSASTTAPFLAGVSPATGAASAAPFLCGTAGNQVAPPAAGTQLAGGTISSNGAANFAAWLS